MDTKLGLAGIGHVALKVADIGRSLEFYRDRLGFAEMMRLNKDDGSLWLAYLRITDTQFLELFPEGKGGRSPKEAGIKLTVEPKMGADGNRQCWIEDPDGNRIEFMQMSTDSMQAEAIRRMRGS
jgi:lactoylglutathione lyase